MLCHTPPCSLRALHHSLIDLQSSIFDCPAILRPAPCAPSTTPLSIFNLQSSIFLYSVLRSAPPVHSPHIPQPDARGIKGISRSAERGTSAATGSPQAPAPRRRCKNGAHHHPALMPPAQRVATASTCKPSAFLVRFSISADIGMQHARSSSRHYRFVRTRSLKCSSVARGGRR